MTWDEFTTLLSGIDGETPLGKIIQVRSETDGEQLKHFTAGQRKIRSDWNKRQIKQRMENDPDYATEQLKGLQNMFAASFGEGG